MPIIYQYLTREILRYFAFVMAVVIGIYLVVDFFEKIDDFIEAALPMTRALVYFSYKIPFIMAQVLPVCILLAVLVTFGLMNKNNEIIALKSSGISVYFLLKPVLSIGIFFSLTLFILSEVVVPLTMSRANRIWYQEVRKETVVFSREKNIWIRGDQTISHVKYFDGTRGAVFGVTVNWFDEGFRLVRRLDAEKGIWQGERWRLEQVVEQRDAGRKVYSHDRMDVDLEFGPQELKRVLKKAEEMSFKELLAYIKKIEAEGYDATANRVDLYAKIAFPFVCIIMCLAATGIAARETVRESGMALNIALGIGLAFLYWIFYSFCVSLGYGEMLPAGLSVWIANVVFLSLGLLLLLHVE